MITAVSTIWRWSRWLANALGLGRQHYRLTVWILAIFHNLPMVRRRAWQSSLAMMDRWLVRTGIAGSTNTEAVKQGAAFNLSMRKLYGRSLAVRPAEAEFAIRNLGSLPSSEHGILLLHADTHFSWHLIDRVLASGGVVLGLRGGGRMIAENEKTVRLAQLVALARKALAEGRHVLVTPFGRQGDLSLGIEFFGRTHKFAPGIARLAARTGALIVPVSVGMSAKGELTVNYEDAWAIDQSSETEGAIIGRCAQWIEQQWRDSPHNIDLLQMEIYLNE